jgi:hypothetical protein
MRDEISERILQKAGLNPSEETERKYLREKIGEIMSVKLVLACAGAFSELEMSRMEHLLEQKDYAAVQGEIVAHIPDPAVVMEKAEADTVDEIKSLMKEMTTSA